MASAQVAHLVYQLERAVSASTTTPHEKWALLIDFEGYSMANASPMKTRDPPESRK